MNWSVYLLVSGNRTYVGSTTDPIRRLRQHNGDIKGGARATRGRTWKLDCYVCGFADRSSACRWEKLIKNRTRGVNNRSAALFLLVFGICPAGPREYQVPEGLEMRNGDRNE